MRLIFVTNFYPPASRGGYEQWCQEVAVGLREKGHEINILTSNYLNSNYVQADPEWVWRMLNLEMELTEYANVVRFFFKRRKLREENLRLLNSLLREINPDAIGIWGMWNLDRNLLELIESSFPGKVVYYLGDYWPFLPNQFEEYWKSHAKNIFTRIPKQLLGTLALRILEKEETYRAKFEHTLFPTEFMEREYQIRGQKSLNSKIIYGAINTSAFTANEKELTKNNVLHLLFVGRLEYEKGVHNAIEAAKLLIELHHFENFRLQIVGDGNKDYVEFLHKKVQENDLGRFVSFEGAYTKEQMPKLYSQADIFLFTSIWQEPFGRVLVEAMAAGVVVVGTATGGAAEILIDGKTGLTYPPEDPTALADKILSLSTDLGLFKTLSTQGKKFATEKFSTERMVGEIECYFQNLLYS